MDGLAIIIGQCINWIIGILFLVTLGGLVWVVSGVGKLKLRMDNDRKKSRGRIDYTPNGYQRNPDTYTWEDTLGYLDEFNHIQLNYDIFEQFIPVFPLLGILGTVAGLIQQLSDITKMQEALGMSMSTTFFGLLAAISLRIVDALWTSKNVNKMSMYFDTFEQNYQIARDKHLQDSESTDK